MRYPNCTKTVIGGLSLLLALSGCSSGSKTKTAAAPTPQTITEKTVVVDDKTVAVQRPSDRVEPTTGTAECSYRLDAAGNRVYDDPSCQRDSGVMTEKAKEPVNYEKSIDAAVSHAWKAEAAGNEGNIPEMLRHTKMSLDQATAAQLASSSGRSDPHLQSGIQDLKDTLVVGSRDRIAPASLRDARVKLVQARTVGLTSGAALQRPQTVKGELARNERATAGGVTGGEQYIVRDAENHEMPIALSPEATQQVQVGDTVEVQIDSTGRVTSITKAQ